MIGLIGRKIGMTQVFDEQGILTPVTVIKIEPNTVVGARTAEKNGYDAVVLGAFDVKESRISKPVRGQFKDPVKPRKYLCELRGYEKECAVGDSLDLAVLDGLRFVDVKGVTKGKGFQGVMKRHGFKGGRDSHGSKFHRSGGSTGSNTNPGRTFKGVGMAGRMGHANFTAQSLRVVRMDAENQLILVKGAVPGASDAVVVVTNSMKKQ
jgi:large subunit ribosomal protein L3